MYRHARRELSLSLSLSLTSVIPVGDRGETRKKLKERRTRERDADPVSLPSLFVRVDF